MQTKQLVKCPDCGNVFKTKKDEAQCYACKIRFNVKENVIKV